MGINAGKLNQPIYVLELSESDTGWSWTVRRKAWAAVEQSETRKVFSANATASRSSVVFTIRRQNLSMFDAIDWQGRHHLITSIEPTKDRAHLTVTAVPANIASCTAEANKVPKGKTFPAALAEKYVRHEQLEPMAVASICYVLITPKPVILQPGSLVDVDGTPYAVLAAHLLDPYRNEYEVMRKADL